MFYKYSSFRPKYQFISTEVFQKPGIEPLLEASSQQFGLRYTLLTQIESYNKEKIKLVQGLRLSRLRTEGDVSNPNSFESCPALTP